MFISKTQLKYQVLPVILFLNIVLFAFLIRVYDLNWDNNFHLHPDERFLTMVGNAMQLPTSFVDYINPDTSKFNPANIGFQFYVYGTLPLILSKIIAIQFHFDNYNDFALQGRMLSAFFDCLTLIVLFKIVLFFEKQYFFSKCIKFFSIFFYAISVLAIQLSHFFTVDTFLNFFVLLSFYFQLYGLKKKYLLFSILSGTAFGCAIATKISAVFALPLLATMICFPILSKLSISKHTKFNSIKLFHPDIAKILCGYILFGLFTYLFARLTDPYLFANTNFFDFHLNTNFLRNIASLEAYSNKEAWFPPSVQWISKPPIIFSGYNLAVFGVGIPFFILSLCGIILLGKNRKAWLIRIVILWMLGFFLYQSTRFASTMRYFILLYPFLAFFAGYGFYYLTFKRNAIIKFILLLFVLFWPLAFFSIYTKPHSRTTASEWIYQKLPNNSKLLSEYWDDGLPLPIQKTYGKTFSSQQIAVFDPDTDIKWQKLNQQLAQSNYYILSSNRGWGSIPTVPSRYPLMSKFYRDLFDSKLQYKKIAEFTSYPSLAYLGIPITIPDQISEEAFTVYDHPKVIIFKNEMKY